MARAEPAAIVGVDAVMAKKRIVLISTGGTIEKTYDGKQPITYAMLTLEGREALKEHWDRLERIRKGAKALTTLKVTS